MKYENIRKAKFIRRINRFVAEIELDGQVKQCHVKNTGRCKELLLKNSEVYVQEFSENCGRKTLYDLITVAKNGFFINIDSQAPNVVFQEFLKNYCKECFSVKREVKYNKSRFDFYVECNERKIFIEVKGVTLENDGICRFPDAPTERGVKHLNELAECIKDGYEAYVVFVVQMENAKRVEPNFDTHFEFGEALNKASESGVGVFAFNCEVKSDYLAIKDSVKVDLRKDIYTKN